MFYFMWGGGIFIRCSSVYYMEHVSHIVYALNAPPSEITAVHHSSNACVLVRGAPGIFWRV